MKSIFSSAAYLVVLFFSATADPVVGSGETLKGPHECATTCIEGSSTYDACMCDCDPYCGTNWKPEGWDSYAACKEKYCEGLISDVLDSDAGTYAGSYGDCDCFCDPECSCNYGTCGGGPINADGTKGPAKPGCIECFGNAPRVA